MAGPHNEESAQGGEAAPDHAANGDSESMSQTCAQEHTDYEPNSAEDPRYDPPESFVIGIDGSGRKHHFELEANTIIVFDELGIDHVQPLEEKTLASWFQHVNEARGWESADDKLSVAIERDAERKEAR